MIEQAIPNHEEELARLAEIGTTGFVIGFGLRFGQPDFFLNRYPEAWTTKYEEENYFFGDPVAAWTIARTGAIRWSEITFPDIRNVMPEAAKHGLIYGATVVTKVGRKRSFMSLARPDREMTDAEMEYLHSQIQLWARLFARSQVALTEGEIDVLRLLRDGLTQGEASERLGISTSTVKFRLSSAQKKFGANRTANVIALAARQNII
ncbi:MULTISPECIES: helix-turn-helix transcriptional regulator [Paracoccus]|uniref:Autoinducer binding domain-containing protein n=2 Tax=Paracoccus TaxID=265 RepID=A0ABT9JGG1_9RHOB|nr:MULTISPECIES: LuxR family transcriptional regulator [Paracoccus]MBU3031159.1 LuxR family transcriptional regulator [Paracoccus marinaquae]MDP5308795.1 autoinducer binding domain-containing protein [Paracoccus sp. 2205BS29-5]